MTDSLKDNNDEDNARCKIKACGGRASVILCKAYNVIHENDEGLLNVCGIFIPVPVAKHDLMDDIIS